MIGRPHKPRTVDEYKTWLGDAHQVDLNRAAAHYDSVTRKAAADIQLSEGWQALIAGRRTMDQAYLVQTSYDLFVQESAPQLLIKPFDSFLEKTFRSNILNNRTWPEEPKDGWILAPNWFGRINDVVRTLMVVKYLDGVKFTADRTSELLKACNVPCSIHFEAREEGYYAAHLYFRVACSVPRQDWDSETVDISTEIQITTQVQEVIRRLLHKYYEDRRLNESRKSAEWRWDYKSQEFAANYLGHVLHYVEGMIMDVREKQERKKS